MWKYIILIFILLFYSCSENKPQSTIQTMKLNIPTKSTVDYFRTHFEVENIVPIVTTDSFLISTISKVIKTKDGILLLSKQDRMVAMINAQTGKLEVCIHKQGNGPGESNHIIDVAFDELSRHILIYNDYSKLLVFDLQGNFLSEIQVDALYECMVYNQGKIIFYNKLEGYSCYPYIFKIYDLQYKKWDNIGYDKKIDFPIRGKGRQMVRSKRIWMNAPLDYNLYCLEENEQKPYYQLDIPTTGLTDDFIEKAVTDPVSFMKKTSKEKIVYNINSVRETTDHLIFHTNLNNFLLLDKKSKKIHLDNFLLKNILYLTPSDYYPHDGDDDNVMFIISAERCVNQPELISGLPDKWKKRIELFDIEKDNNPILLFFKEKI